MTRIPPYAGALLAAMLFATGARAQVLAPVQSPVLASPFGTIDPVATVQLGTIAGQANVQQAIFAENNADVSHNVVSGNSVTGTIGFGAAFQNLNGLSVLSANTGNNVAINSSLNVNIAIQP